MITLAIICLTFKISYGQSELDRPTPKNEIGMHIGGLLKSVVNGVYRRSVEQPWGLTYKRVNGNWATRVGFIYQFNEGPLQQLGGSLILPNGNYESRSTDAQIRQNIFRLGREYRIPLKYNVQLVFGADIQVRKFHFFSSQYSTISEIDTILNPGTTAQDIKYESVTFSRIQSTEISSWQYGIGLTCGVMIPLGKRFWLNGNVRFDSFYGIANDTNYDIIGNTFSRNKSGLLDVNTLGPFSELSLFYRF